MRFFSKTRAVAGNSLTISPTVMAGVMLTVLSPTRARTGPGSGTVGGKMYMCIHYSFFRELTPVTGRPRVIAKDPQFCGAADSERATCL